MFTEKLKKILDRSKFLEIKLQGQLERKELEELSKEYSQLKEITELVERFFNIEKEIKLTGELLEDRDLVELAENEIGLLEKEKSDLENQLKLLLLPKDADDDRAVIVEIRAGTGGDEASLFAQDLYRMYTRFSDEKKWKTEIIEQSYTGVGGVKELIFHIKGENIFSNLKFESGVHRVQRVPTTESGGRIHTSAATVAEAKPPLPPVQLSYAPVRPAPPAPQTFTSIVSTPSGTPPLINSTLCPLSVAFQNTVSPTLTLTIFFE